MAVSCIVAASSVAEKRTNADGCVAVACRVVKKRVKTDSRITATGSKALESIITFGGIAARITSVRRRR